MNDREKTEKEGNNRSAVAGKSNYILGKRKAALIFSYQAMAATFFDGSIKSLSFLKVI